MNATIIDSPDITIGVFSLVLGISILSLAANGLVLAVLFSTERLARRVVCLFYLCSSLLYTTIVGIIQWSTMLYAYTTDTDLQRPLEVIMGLLNSADMITCSAVVVLTFDQYLYIEKPLSHNRHITKTGLLVANIGLTLLSIALGLAPVLSRSAIGWFIGLVFCMCWTILATLFIGMMYIRMLCIAQQHRAKIQQVEKTHRCDSLVFFVLIFATLFISFLLPALLNLWYMESAYYITPLYLVAAVVFPIAYGSRFPRGLLQSIKMTVCCCFPVETLDPNKSSLQVETAIRLAMMRLGRTMIRIDEQSAIKRHKSFMQRKANWQKTFTIRRSRFSISSEQNTPVKRVASLFTPWMRPNSYLLGNGAHESLAKSQSDGSTLENTKRNGKRVTWHPVAHGSEPIFCTEDEATVATKPDTSQSDGRTKKLVSWRDDGSDVSASTPLNTEVEVICTRGSGLGSISGTKDLSDSINPDNISRTIDTDDHPEPKLSPLPSERENNPCVLRAAYPQRSLSPLPTLKNYENDNSTLSESDSDSGLSSGVPQ